jgi:ADP-heptose:LPS heptosyltransferase
MISKVAIFRALYLGDMLCIIPTVRAIRTAYPTAEIFLVGLPWQRDLVSRFQRYFDHFIEFPGWPGLPEQEPNAERIIHFLQQIREHRFDLVLQMQGNGEITNSLCMLWNGATHCGLRKPGEYAPDPSLFPVSEDGEHEIMRFFKLLEALGIPSQGTFLEFPTAEHEDKQAREIISKTSLKVNHYICIHPGARDIRRRWPVSNFAFVANRLLADGYQLALTGSDAERSLLAELERSISGSVVNIVERFGHVPAGTLAGIIKRARLLISNDTGVSHIAAAVHTPSVIIFSAFSDLSRWRPLDRIRHVAIPYHQAQNPDLVLQTAVESLNLSKIPVNSLSVEQNSTFFPDNPNG